MLAQESFIKYSRKNNHNSTRVLLAKKKKATFFREAHITLVPISDKANTRKKNYRSTSFRNLVAKIPNEF